MFAVSDAAARGTNGKTKLESRMKWKGAWVSIIHQAPFFHILSDPSHSFPCPRPRCTPNFPRFSPHFPSIPPPSLIFFPSCLLRHRTPAPPPPRHPPPHPPRLLLSLHPLLRRLRPRPRRLLRPRRLPLPDLPLLDPRPLPPPLRLPHPPLRPHLSRHLLPPPPPPLTLATGKDPSAKVARHFRHAAQIPCRRNRTPRPLPRLLPSPSPTVSSPKRPRPPPAESSLTRPGIPTPIINYPSRTRSGHSCV